jgi:hypothetical protein
VGSQNSWLVDVECECDGDCERCDAECDDDSWLAELLSEL